MFSIVVFTKENVCEGVPTSWIKSVGKEVFCCWPVKGDVRKLIKKCANPGSFAWTLSKCIVKATAVDFFAMIQKRKEAEILTTEHQSSDSECDVPAVTLTNSAVRAHSDSETEQVLYMKYPTPPKKWLLQTSETNKREVLSARKKKITFEDSEEENFAPSKKRVNSRGIFSDPMRASTANQEASEANSSATPNFAIMMQEVMNTVKIGFTDNNKLILELKEEVKILRKMVRGNQTKPTIITDSSIPPLPIDSEEGMNRLEDVLQSEDERLNLVSSLTLVGGNSARSLANNLLNHSMTREVAMKYNLHGKSGKKCFKDISLFKCIFEAMKNHHLCTAVDSSAILKYIGYNLIYAKDRVKKRRGRMTENLREENDLEEEQ